MIVVHSDDSACQLQTFCKSVCWLFLVLLVFVVLFVVFYIFCCWFVCFVLLVIAFPRLLSWFLYVDAADLRDREFRTRSSGNVVLLDMCAKLRVIAIIFCLGSHCDARVCLSR